MVGKQKFIVSFILFALSLVLNAKVVELPLTGVEAYLKNSQPGDTVLVCSGEYSDIQMKWIGKGSKGHNVVVMPKTEGGVVISGRSSLKIFGEYLTISSLHFSSVCPVRVRGALVEFRNGDQLANNCRLTNTVIDGYNSDERSFVSSYVHLYGRYNRVDHCNFLGKKSLGVTLIVMLNYDNCDENYHSIDNNFFGYRPVYGSNGAETIRIGTSQQCMQSSRSIVKDNVFYRCNGEVEVVSIKSCDNTVRDNVFYECEGVLALRHGDRNIASGNVFVGNGMRNTGGVRVVGEDQVVENNKFYGLAGERFFSALALMNAVPNSLPNRYMQVKNTAIKGNEFINCASIDFGTGADYERTLAPVDVRFEKNYIYTDSKAYNFHSDSSGISFKANKIRKSKSYDYSLNLLGKGASWYRDKSNSCSSKARTITVKSFDELAKACESAADGDRILLASPLFELENGLKIKAKLSLIASCNSEQSSVSGGKEPYAPVEFKYVGRKSESMISICDGGELYIKGVKLNGILTSGRSLAKAGISTNDKMLEPYNLKVENCVFVNYGESGFNPIKGTKGTFANKVEIINSHFEALSGDAINYAAETDDKGIYNCDDLIIDGCTFERILGLPINVYRGGSDESTAGPYVYVSNCEFDDCCNKIRGSVIRIVGAQILNISSCIFNDSGRGGYSIRLDEAPWERVKLSKLEFNNSGKVLSNNRLYQASETTGRHPNLLLTKAGVEQINQNLASMPDFQKCVDEVIASADEACEKEIIIPKPVDGGGGYSHELHKLNYYDMYNCGIAYQLTANKKYAERVKQTLLGYAKIYKSLPFHPLGLSATPGRIFWQTLNESVWLVHTSMAYDCVYDFLTAKEHKYLEENLFYPIADFIMNGMDGNTANNAVFNKMHNHGTWATAAVGMIAIVMGDDNLLDQALYGSDKTGKNGGFIQQLDYLFSPDGYFTEGAYYQRYAIWPFVTFAQCIENNRPELKIFKYRDSIILKAVDTLLQMAYNGLFLRFNDALEKGYNAQELIAAVNIAYNADKSNKKLLSIAKQYQNKAQVSDAGYAISKSIQDGEAEKFEYKSILLRDGGNGEDGGLTLMRSRDKNLNSLISFKATSHGLSHGHYDKLTFAYYDNDNEIITDYGASRFLNIEAKYNGHYTKQNKSYAMTTIAHNTVVVDEKSHFDGKISKSSKHHPDIYYSNFDKENYQIVSAIEQNAYKNVSMHRTMVYVQTPFLQYPVILDVFKTQSDKAHTLDYPIHYNGHMINLSCPYTKSMTQMSVLGENNGYQHFWLEAKADKVSDLTTYTWLTGDRMYSISTVTSPQTEVYLASIGANDFDYNLRNEPMYLIREKGKSNHSFVSCIETHGKYDLQVEQSSNLVHSCKTIDILIDSDEYFVARYTFINGNTMLFCFSYKDASEETKHKIEFEGKKIKWQGPSYIEFGLTTKQK